MIIRKAFVYRLYPRAPQVAVLDQVLWRCRELYNAGLEERREAYRKAGVSLSSAGQQAHLPAIKQIRPEYVDLDAQMLQFRTCCNGWIGPSPPSFAASRAGWARQASPASEAGIATIP